MDARVSAIYAAGADSTLIWGRTMLADAFAFGVGQRWVGCCRFLVRAGALWTRTESGRATPWRGLLISGNWGRDCWRFRLRQTVIGRTAYNRVSHMPLLLSLCLALLWQGWSIPARSLFAQHCAKSGGAA